MATKFAQSRAQLKDSSKEDFNALMSVCHKGQEAVVNGLLQGNVNTNIQDQKRETSAAAPVTCFPDQPQASSLVNARGLAGETALSIARKKQHAGIVRLLEDYGGETEESSSCSRPDSAGADHRLLRNHCNCERRRQDHAQDSEESTDHAKDENHQLPRERIVKAKYVTNGGTVTVNKCCGACPCTHRRIDSDDSTSTASSSSSRNSSSDEQSQENAEGL